MTCNLRIARLALVAIASLVPFASACNSAGPHDPLEPGPGPEPEPEGSGSLEVTVTVDGTRPDPDGYAVVIVLASEDTPGPGVPVEPAGGTVRFSELLPGSHSVRLENLAANCFVTNANPRAFTIAPEETSRVTFLVQCPGPGKLQVRTVSAGVDLDPDGYALTLEASSIREERIGTNDSLTIEAEELSPDGIWGVRLTVEGDHCLAESRVTPGRAVATFEPLKVRLLDDVTVRITFTIACLQRSSRIAFQGADSPSDIFIVPALGGSQARNLTNHPAADMSPALSPDRSRVVFVSDRDDPTGTGQTDLYSVHADGSGLIRLTNSPGHDWVGPQAWSPDGSRIVFWSTRDNPSGELYTMNSDGSGVDRLTDHGSSPAWSPDGQWIAFSKDGGIYRMSPINGSAELLVTSDGFDPSWSPDGSKIAFSRGYGWDWPLADLAVIGADGTGFVQLHPNLDNNDVSFGPSWSPDGSWIAFTRVRSISQEVVIVPFLDAGFGEGIRITAGGSPSWR
jgi:Tol biopolymer transport system component